MGPSRILIIAGSDSSGGAGLEADQKVVAAHGCYAMTATTALTAQNTQGVYDIHVPPTAFVEKQIDACFDDIGVDVVKTGMLASAGTVSAVASAVQRHSVNWMVVDPVMVSTSGAQLLPEDAVQTLREKLLPVTTVLTPNIPEALLLLKDSGHSVEHPKSTQDLINIALMVHQLGPEAVLLKGGHLPLNHEEGHEVVDVLCKNNNAEIIKTEYIESKNTHGTGCSLASAAASRLCLGHTLDQAIKGAIQYVKAGIKYSHNLGKGNGPLNHFHSTYTLPFSPDHFITYLLEYPHTQPLWHAYTHHPFVQQLSTGSLPLPAFRHYLIQDYLYLIQFARANALAAYKAPSMTDCATSAAIVTHIQKEMSLHISYCHDFGLSQSNLEAQKEDQACTAYTRYVLDVGMQQDWLALQVALAPCLLGYGEIAEDIMKDAGSVKGVERNPYWRWVENYCAEDYQQAVEQGRRILESHATGLSVKRVQELVEVFAHATKMEIGFWDMGLAHADDGA